MRDNFGKFFFRERATLIEFRGVGGTKLGDFGAPPEQFLTRDRIWAFGHVHSAVVRCRAIDWIDIGFFSALWDGGQLSRWEGCVLPPGHYMDRRPAPQAAGLQTSAQ